MLSRNDLAQEPQKGIEPLTAGVNPGAFGSTLCALSEGSERGTVPQPPRTDAETAHRTTDERQTVAEIGSGLNSYVLIGTYGCDRVFDAPSDAVAFAVAMLLGDGMIEAVRRGLAWGTVAMGAYVFPRTDAMKLSAWCSHGSIPLADMIVEVVAALRSVRLPMENPTERELLDFKVQKTLVDGYIAMLPRIYGGASV